MAEHDGWLHFWRIEDDFGYRFVRAVIVGDRRGRFQDGEIICTSSILGDPEGDIVRTKNSIYRLVPRQASLNLMSEGARVLHSDAMTQTKG